jgi:hypothetical protein
LGRHHAHGGDVGFGDYAPSRDCFGIAQIEKVLMWRNYEDDAHCSVRMGEILVLSNGIVVE